MKQIFSIILIMLIGVLTAEVVLDEDFESGSIPGDWTQEYIDGTSPWIVSNGGYNGHPEEANSGFYNARFFVQDTDGSTTRLITPQFNLGINEVGTLTFYHAQQSWVGYQDELKVYYKNAPDGEWILLVSVTVDTPTWTLRQLTLPNPSTTYWLAFEGYAEYGYGVCIDDVHIDGEPMYNSDLQGIALTGPGNVTAGNSESFTITIFNAGIEPQSDYYLKLFKPGGIEIASQLVEDEIAAGSTENHFIVWNISDTEPEAYHDIYGSVELASDENIYNNETPPLTVHVSPPGTQYLIEEGFEGGEIPAGWTQEYLEGTHDWAVQTGGGSSNPPAAHTGTYNAAFTHTTSGTKTILITPEISMGTANPGTLTFWHTQQVWASDQDELRIYYKNSQAGDWVLIEEYTENIESWTEETITLPNPSPNYQVAFEAEDQYGYGVCLDDIVIIGNPTVFDNDLAMIAIDGAEITNAGNSEMYEVQVKNVGDLPQSDYTVYLKKVGNNVIASQTITETLNPGEIAIHNLVWNIPANEPDGFTNIWAEVDLDGDENTGNNTSSQISVQIFPQGILEVIVGDGDETNVRVPICFEYLNSLTETIYFPNELNNLTGHINAITYYNSFSSNITNKPTKVWMGETSLTSLVDGWIPASQLTLVFDGIISEGKEILPVLMEKSGYDRVYSPTALETYAICPLRYFFRYLLHLKKPETDYPLGSPAQRGEQIHEILFRYLSEIHQNGTMIKKENHDDHLTGLLATANACANDLITSDPFINVWFDHLTKGKSGAPGILEQFLICEEEREDHLFAPTLFEYSFGHTQRSGRCDPLSDENPVSLQSPEGHSILLSGSIDRVDCTPERKAVVLDYKTGSFATLSDIKNGTALQLPLYMAALRERTGLLPICGAYYAISEKECGPKAVLFAPEERDLIRGYHPSGKIEPGGLEMLINSALQHADEMIAKAQAGLFPLSSDLSHCPSYCEFSTICRKDALRLLESEQSNNLPEAKEEI